MAFVSFCLYVKDVDFTRKTAGFVSSERSDNMRDIMRFLHSLVGR